MPLDKQARTSVMTQERLHSLFDYVDGHLVWKNRTGGKAYLNGRIAGTIIKKGYRQITIKGVSYRAARLVFLYHNGYMPEVVDHANNNRADDRVENLRETTYHGNNQNVQLTSRNKSGVKGVFWDNSANSWCATVYAKNKVVVKKHVQDLELAELIVIMGREKYHGQFANHGACQ